MAKYIPKQHYIGYHNTVTGAGAVKTNDVLPLAFMTPDGTDAPAKKRKETVDRWTRNGYGTDENNILETIDNPKLNGFRIADDIIKRCSTQNVLWRIMDPRGFKLEISSGNMAYIIGNALIKNGLIESEMQWCRDGANNFLLPVNSKEYENYNTYSISEKVKKSDLTKGDIINIGDGEGDFKFLDKYHLMAKNEYGEDGSALFKVEHLLVFQSMRDENAFHVRKTISKNTTIVKKTDVEDTKDYSDLIVKHRGKIVSTSWSYSLNTALVVASKVKINVRDTENTIKLIEIDDSFYTTQYHGRTSETHYFKYKGKIYEREYIKVPEYPDYLRINVKPICVNFDDNTLINNNRTHTSPETYIDNDPYVLGRIKGNLPLSYNRDPIMIDHKLISKEIYGLEIEVQGKKWIYV